MEGFMKFKKALQKHFDEMQKEATHLFEVNVDKDELWNTYLDSFPAGTNEIFRERREHDCSCCRQFIKNIGSAVTIKDNQIHTIWELNLGDTTYQPVCDALDAFVKAYTVTDIYTTKFPKIGTDFNFEEINGKSHQWDHLFLELPSKFVNRSSRSNEEVKGQFRDTRNVFKRSLDEITMDALDTILELINSNTLYKGEEWKGVLTEFKKYKKEYDKLTSDTEKDLYAWEKSVTAGMAIGRELGLPSELVDKTPTDGLCGKTDEDNLGFTYAELDAYIRDGIEPSEEVKAKIDSMHEKNLFKLQPMPSFVYQA